MPKCTNESKRYCFDCTWSISYKDDKDAENLMKEIKKNKEYFEYEYDLDENGDNK